MSLVTNLGFFLLAVAVLVSFHEFGHFIVARWMGVRVLKFSVGFGRTVWRWQTNPDTTEYAIGLVPLGGYVRITDLLANPRPPISCSHFGAGHPIFSWPRTRAICD